MRRLLAAVLAAVVLLPAVGCAARPAEPESGKLRVVCSLFPYYDFVRAIGGEDVEAELMLLPKRLRPVGLVVKLIPRSLYFCMM